MNCFAFIRIGCGVLGTVALLAGCPASVGGGSSTTGASGQESDTYSDECATGGDACCPGASWCDYYTGSSTWVGDGDGADSETYDPDCATEDGDCCDQSCETGTGQGIGGCLCFETTEFSLLDTCERPPSCGIVKLPATDIDKAFPPLTLEEEMANVATIACFLDAIGDGQQSVISSDLSADQLQYERTVIAEQSGDGVTWEHQMDDVLETITPVVYTYGLASLTTCSDAGDSVAQWDCIITALAERGAAGPECTEQVQFEGK